MVTIHAVPKAVGSSRVKNLVATLEYRNVYDKSQNAIAEITRSYREQVADVLQQKKTESNDLTPAMDVKESKDQIRSRYMQSFAELNDEKRLDFENVEPAFDFLNTGIELMEWEDTLFFDDNTHPDVFWAALTSLSSAIDELTIKTNDKVARNAAKKIHNLLTAYYKALEKHIKKLTNPEHKINFTKMRDELDEILSGGGAEPMIKSKENGKAA